MPRDSGHNPLGSRCFVQFLHVTETVLERKHNGLRPEKRKSALHRLRCSGRFYEDDDEIGFPRLRRIGRAPNGADNAVAADAFYRKPRCVHRVDMLLPDVDKRYVESRFGEHAAVKRTHCA